MDKWELNAMINHSFTNAENAFLHTNKEFKAALSRASKENMEEILQLGVRLLLTRGYESPAPHEKPDK